MRSSKSSRIRPASIFSVNDCLRPVSRYFDRIWRPEQLAACAPQRHARPHRPRRDRRGHHRAAPGPRHRGIRGARRPSRASRVASEALAGRARAPRRGRHDGPRLAPAAACRRRWGHLLRRHRGSPRLAAATGLPVAETQAGKGALRYDHPASLGSLGTTGTTAANEIARDADLVIGVGTRWSDFTDRLTLGLPGPDVRFANINVTPFDSTKHAGLAVVADARGARGLAERLGRWRVDEASRRGARRLASAWNKTVEAARQHHTPFAQTQIIGLVRGRLRRLRRGRVCRRKPAG